MLDRIKCAAVLVREALRFLWNKDQCGAVIIIGRMNAADMDGLISKLERERTRLRWMEALLPPTMPPLPPDLIGSPSQDN